MNINAIFNTLLFNIGSFFFLPSAMTKINMEEYFQEYQIHRVLEINEKQVTYNNLLIRTTWNQNKLLY